MTHSIWGKLGGAGIGLALGGPIGALLGGMAGHVLVDREGALFGPAPRDLVFTTGLVALAAKMAKSDGVVVRHEVEAFERIVEVPDSEHARVKSLFDLAKGTTDGYEAYARQIAELLRDEPHLLEDVLDGLFHIAKADGAVHEAEFAYLQSVATIFGIEGKDFDRISARHVRRADDPYLILGADRAMSDADLKRHYRRLVAENHPDREIARGLPPEAVGIATQRLAVINAAWEQVAAERGIR
ncbi:MAG TPA: TerB family tellurite resistance protein [Microvirga sp.]|jgi:DnaJ like chaperone protein|nr:TerB family tellurite resistance protein [Microvirga sp.]